MKKGNLNRNNFSKSTYFGNNDNDFNHKDFTFLGKKIKSSNFIEEDNLSTNKYKEREKNYNNKYHNNKDINHEDYNNNERKYDNDIQQNNNYKNKTNYYNKDKESISDNYKEKSNLPIFKEKEEILEQIQKNRIIIVSGNTGCGKSTQVPQFIFDNFKNSKILITQPRRIAAISIANRLSFERGTKLGKLIGYHVSMIQNFSFETNIFVKTTGIFLEELLHNEELKYSYIILDEVHERDLYIDLVLALLKKYFEEFPKSNIKLILMSATIAELDFARYLKDSNFNKDVPIIRIKEKWHEVKNFYIEDILNILQKSDKISEKLKKKIEEEKSNCISLCYENPIYSDSLFPIVAGIIEKTEKGYLDSKKGILIFIPGLAEIQDLLEYLNNYFTDNNEFEFLILHSQVTDDEQEKAFTYNEKKRKIILATNIAESSITISNIDFVVDFCLVKQKKFDDNQNTSVLELNWCSKASCQQRKGRTGRVAKGYYFQLITRELFKKFKEHQEPEILRTPLETPILKLKLYDKQEEPEKILFKTMNHPSQEVIIKTIFRLQKMGALVNINFDENQMNEDEEEIKCNEKEKKIIYSSGKITKIGEIYADLPIDIKFSRLIILSYALGQIDVGISLAAILSQDRPLFLNSNLCNRLSLYDIKNHYCNKQNCDFTALYIAYKFWCSKFKKEFISEEIDFDTRLRKIDRRKYKEIINYTKKRNLDLKTLKQIITVENELKKRLCLKGLYSKFFEPKKGEVKTLNLLDENTSLILKIILAGTFYNQIFIPEYDNFQAVDSDINKKNKSDINQQKTQDDLTTIRIFNISFEEKNKLIEIFKEIIKPGLIVKEDYENNAEMLTIKFSDIESVRKILFITSPCLKHNNEIPLFKYIDKIQKEDKESINRNYTEDKTILIKLSREPEYLYNAHYYDVYIGGQIFLDKDSINLTYIIPNFDELKRTKFVTDSYINKNGYTINKYARYTSLLPKESMFDKLMILIFGPKIEMIASKVENTDINSHYIGFQSYEFEGPNYFDYEMEYDKIPLKKMIKSNFIKFDFLISNYHLQIINEIRYMINRMIDLRFNINNKEDNLAKIEFEEKKNKYINSTNNILVKIKNLVYETKIKFINDKKYEELFNYIQKFKSKYKNIIKNKEEINKIDEENIEIEKKKFQGSESIYLEYINEMKKLVTNEEDFLQKIEPLEIQEEYYYNEIKKKKLYNDEKKISNIYNDYNDVLNLIKSLVNNKEPWLCCPGCSADICAIKFGSPKMTKNNNLGEHIIEGAWITNSFKSVKENKDNINNEQIEKFKEKLNKYSIKYDDLFCCPSGETVIGYMIKDERFIYFGSNLFVKYPDLSVDKIYDDDYKNDFQKIHQKLKGILLEKENKEFKNLICCKLCGFTIKKNIREFKDHLNKKSHKEKMEELKMEFSF